MSNIDVLSAVVLAAMLVCVLGAWRCQRNRRTVSELLATCRVRHRPPPPAKCCKKVDFPQNLAEK